MNWNDTFDSISTALGVCGGLAIVSWVFVKNFSRPLQEWYRRRAAANWLLAEASIETGYIEPFQRFYAAMLGYSYVEGDKRYSGYWMGGPMAQDAAEMLPIRTRGRNLAIRYKPEKPAVSVVRLEDNPKWVPWSL